MLAGPPRRVLVLRALQLGDLLRAVPALRAMRRAWPHATIGLIGLPWARALVDRLPGYVDELHEFPGWPGVPEAPFEPARSIAFLERLGRERADLAIQLHGSGVHTNAFVALLGAARTAGTYVPGTTPPAGGAFVPLDETASETRRCLAVLEPLGVRPAGTRLELEVHGRDHDDADRALHRAGAGEAIADGYAIVHAGGRSARRWPAARFAAVADALADDVPVVLTGTAEERPVGDEIAARMGRPVIDLVGSTSMGALFALVRDARVVVSNDTGVSHVADALGVPSVVVYTTSDATRWAPEDRDLHRVVVGVAEAPEVIAQARELLVSSRSGSAR